MSMFGRPLVSVVMASYNHADFVGQAIESVLRQTVRDLELIVIDDASSDGTYGAIRRFKDKRVKFIRLEQNRQFHPRNLGISKSRGRYIAFQNSDDVWEKNKLELQLKEFNAKKNLAACFTGVEVISKKSTKLNKSWANGLFVTNNMPSELWLRRFFDVGNGLCISSAMVRRSMLKKAGPFDESLVQLSDLDLWVRMATSGSLHVIDKKLTKMRIVEGRNISQPTPVAQRRSILEKAQLLERYSDGKVDLYKVFPNIVKAPNLPKVINNFYLARYASGKSPAHRLFADRLFAQLFSNSANRNVINAHFGPQAFKDFIEKRSQLELRVHG